MTHHKIEYKESDLEELEGETEKGLVRDRYHGIASGCVELTSAQVKQLQLKKVVADNQIEGTDVSLRTTFEEAKKRKLGTVGLKIASADDGTTKLSLSSGKTATIRIRILTMTFCHR